MIKLDAKDRKILYLLDRDSRSTNKAIAKKVRLTEQSVGYRIRRLVDSGIIKRFVTFINTVSLGYTHYKVLLKLQNTDEEIEDALIKSLAANRNIRWVVSMIGRYDISFSVLAKNLEELDSIMEDIDSGFGKYVMEKNISLNLRSPGFTREWIIGGKEARMLEYKTGETVHDLDEADIKILKSLSQDARKNVVDIARENSLTADIVRYRIKKMTGSGVISGYTLQLDLEKMGYEYYSVLFNTQNMDRKAYTRMLTFASLHPNILYVVKTLGKHDLQLEIEVQNASALDSLLKDFRKEFMGIIRDFEILRMTKEYKYDFYPF